MAFSKTVTCPSPLAMMRSLSRALNSLPMRPERLCRKLNELLPALFRSFAVKYSHLTRGVEFKHKQPAEFAVQDCV